MPPSALLLLFISALLHTSWNLLLKGAPEKYIASWWTTVFGGLLVIPLLFVTGLPPASVWWLLLLSALVEAAYFISLSYAFQDNDFSLVYPIARGSAPAFLLLWAFVFLGERFTAGGLVGLALIVAGLLVIGSPALHRTQCGASVGGLRGGRARKTRLAGEAPARSAGMLMALLTAVFISIYTAIDGTAVKQVDPLKYALALFALIPLLVTPLVMRRYGWTRLSAEVKAYWPRMAGMVLLGVVAYGLALQAYHIAPVGYAGAIREMSVVMGAFAGWRLLGEDFGPLRVAGAVVVFGGIVTIAVWG